MSIRVVLGGDTMLGRLVKDAIKMYGPQYPMGQIAELMRQGDLTIVNLECAITQSGHHWHGLEKAFYFGAPPEAAFSLKKVGVDLVSLANNHILDFNLQGLSDTIHYLREQGIHFAGAGTNIKQALRPAIIACKKSIFGMVSFCDHQADFAADVDRAGMAYIDLNREGAAIHLFKTCIEYMRKQNVNWPILSLHWGSNWAIKPPKNFIRIAHAAIDAGYKTIFGHSAHVFQGIEIYKGFPIFYACGDLVDDYYVDDWEKNDHQLLFEMIISDHQLKQISLYPVFIEQFRTIPANKKQFEYISNKMIARSGELGTDFKVCDHQKLTVAF